MDPVTMTPLRDRLGMASWGVLCVSGMYLCLYYTAHKHLRLWLAVRKVLKYRKDDSSGSTSSRYTQPTLTDPSSALSESWSRYIPRIIKASAAAPVIAWAYRTYTLGAGYLDITVIAICYVCIVVAICCVIGLADQDLAVTPQATTKALPKGWAIVPSTSADLNTRMKTIFLAFPIASVLMCTWLLTRESPTLKPVGDAMFIIMLCLAPIVGVRVVRATDIRMKHVFLIGLAGIGIIVVTFVTLSLITLLSGPDVTPPPTEETGNGFIVWVFAHAATKEFFDLCVMFRTGQMAGIMYLPVFAILRFEYNQAIGSSEAEYTAIGQVDSMLDSEDKDPASPGVEKTVSAIPSAANDNPSTSEIELVPIALPPFPTPLFHTAVAGGYIGSLLALLFFPQPAIWDICTLAAFGGILVALGGRLLVGGRAQWKALWNYEEVWTAKPVKQEEAA